MLLLILCAFLAWRHRARWLPSLVAYAAYIAAPSPLSKVGCARAPIR